MMEPTSDDTTPTSSGATTGTKRRPSPPSVFRDVVPMDGSSDLLSLIPEYDPTSSGGEGEGDSNTNDNNNQTQRQDQGLLQLDSNIVSSRGADWATSITSLGTSASQQQQHTDPSSFISRNPQDAVSSFPSSAVAVHVDNVDNVDNAAMPIPAASPQVIPTDHTAPTPMMTNVRSRKGNRKHHSQSGPSSASRRRKRHNNNRNGNQQNLSASSIGGSGGPPQSPSKRLLWWLCCRDRKMVRSTLTCMNVVARILLWCSLLALVAAVVWYSYELKNNGYVVLRTGTIVYVVFL